MNHFVYKHLKKDTKEIFYIGIGTSYPYKKYGRAYSKSNRSNWWNKIVNKHGFEWFILYDNLSFEDAKIKEKELISFYGRMDLGTGVLCNLTNGGDGIVGIKITEENRLKAKERVIYYSSIGKHPRLGKKHSKESKELMSLAKTGKKYNNKETFRKAKSVGNYYVYKNNNFLGCFISTTEVSEKLNIPARSVAMLAKTGTIGKMRKIKDYKIIHTPKKD